MLLAAKEVIRAAASAVASNAGFEVELGRWTGERLKRGELKLKQLIGRLQFF